MPLTQLFDSHESQKTKTENNQAAAYKHFCVVRQQWNIEGLFFTMPHNIKNKSNTNQNARRDNNVRFNHEIAH